MKTGKLELPINPTFPQLEEQVLQYWKENQTFEKSIASRPADKQWNFVDGPPFITGMPHYGSLLSSLPKDVFPRYWTMKGYRVRRVWGWDCHGLPAENKVENQFGLQRKKDIEEKLGVKKFIQAIKQYVNQVSSEWKWYVEHIGRWVDFDHAYRTMDLEYMETILWVFRQLYDKGLIYRGLRVSMYCPHCVTPISNFEVSMDADNYQSVTESATIYKYKLADEDVYLLAWSTTPWNKLVTPALAVNPEIEYVKVRQNDETYILAANRLEMLDPEPEYQVLERFPGRELVGRRFEPHYDFYPVPEDKKAFVVVGADFVSDQEGTGIVTLAAYGEDDLRVMQAQGIVTPLHLDEEGYLLPEVPQFAGKYYLDVNPLVNQDLAARGLIYRDDQLTHRVPTCWRCHTRLYYAPIEAWFVDIQQLKPQLIEANQEINWIPEHFKLGRFLHTIKTAPDWCISRNRYWGSPVPVWQCDQGHFNVPGSLSELSDWSGQQVTDLHKPEIDEITFACRECGQTATRVPEVLDSWIEAGSAPYAERHYPFAKIDLQEFFPTDFITEYTGQIRAWFYVMHVLGVALFGSHAFKNVLVTGVILGNDGRKMSKNFGNYPDPKKLLTTLGGDAFRLYLLSSPVMHAEDIWISEVDYRNAVRAWLRPLWNSYRYYATYRQRYPEGQTGPVQALDRWIQARLEQTVSQVTQALEAYDTVIAARACQTFINDLSNWYIRRSRARVSPTHQPEDRERFLHQLKQVLARFSQVMAPLAPFITEAIYLQLQPDQESVHLTDWPPVDQSAVDDALLEQMSLVRQVVEKIHAQRKQHKLPVRQPLAEVRVVSDQAKPTDELVAILLDEVNIKKLDWQQQSKANLSVEIDTQLDDQLRAEGRARELIRLIQAARRQAGCRLDEYVDAQVPDLPAGFEQQIKQQTLVRNLQVGGEQVVIHRQQADEA